MLVTKLHFILTKYAYFLPAPLVFKIYLKEIILETKVFRYFTKLVLLTRSCLISKLNHNEKYKNILFKVFTGTKMFIKIQGKILLLFLAMKHNDETDSLTT